jgi:hypothetical protein
MTIVYEIAFRADVGRTDAIRRWFEAGPAKMWRELPQLLTFDAYFPSAGHPQDPYVHDGPGPRALCMLTFADERTLRSAITAAAFVRGLADVPAGAATTADAMARKFYSTAGDTGVQDLGAPFSYMVRYHRPAEDEHAFVENYIASHPMLLMKLPNVRTVLCDFPIAWQDPNGLPSADYMLGNEVAFDSVDHFNAAMASEVRHELRRHYRELPPFSGRNTHYPMHRTRII